MTNDFEAVNCELNQKRIDFIKEAVYKQYVEAPTPLEKLTAIQVGREMEIGHDYIKVLVDDYTKSVSLEKL